MVRRLPPPPLLVAGLAIACGSPCEDKTRFPRGDEHTWMRDRTELVLSWMPLDAFCLDEVAATQDLGDDYQKVTWTRRKKHWTVAVDPTSKYAAYYLGMGLCAAIEHEQRLVREAPDGLFDDTQDFLDHCAWGPTTPWSTQIAACDLDPPSRQRQWIDAHVYPRSTRYPDFGLERLPDSDLGSDVGFLTAYSATATELITLSTDAAEHRVVALDPAGAHELARFPRFELTYADGIAADAEWAGVPLRTWPDTWELAVVDRSTGAVEIVPLSMPPAWPSQFQQIAMVGGRLVVQEDRFADDDTLAVIDRDGTVQRIALPDPEPPLTTDIGNIFPWGARVVIHYAESYQQQVLSDVFSTYWYDQHIAVLDPATGSHEPVYDFNGWEGDPVLYSLGVTPDGHLLGTLSLPNEVDLVARIDLRTGALEVSGDLCADQPGEPTWVVGDEAWALTRDEGNLSILRWRVE